MFGRGQSIPLSQIKKQEACRGHTNACTSANLPPPITMKLDHQCPPVTYSEVASRPPSRVTTTPDDLEMCNMWIKVAAHEREKEATWATLDWIRQQNGTNKPPKEMKRSTSSKEFTSVRPDISWQRRGLSSRRSIIMSKGPLELVPIPSPIPWDGVNMGGPERTSTKVPNGLEIYGTPAPWTTSNWS